MMRSLSWVWVLEGVDAEGVEGVEGGVCHVGEQKMLPFACSLLPVLVYRRRLCALLVS
jgi:hypothetical protein